ncbi:MAG: HIT domain-containing protein [archaeon]
MQDQNCIFCKIAKNEIPSKKVYEDEKFVAFLDISPKSKGHALVIPKDHYESFLEMPGELEKEMFALAQKLGRKLKEKLSAKYVFLLVMGVDVPHTHVHLIPSYEGDSEPYAVQLGPSKKFDLDAVLSELIGGEE